MRWVPSVISLYQPILSCVGLNNRIGCTYCPLGMCCVRVFVCVFFVQCTKYVGLQHMMLCSALVCVCSVYVCVCMCARVFCL